MLLFKQVSLFAPYDEILSRKERDMHESLEISKAMLMPRLTEGWEAFNAFLGTLSEEQLTRPTDAAGWTAKDHIIHLAVWERGILALLEGKSRMESMGVSAWEDGDVMNEEIRQNHKDLSLEEVLHIFRQVHDNMMQKLDTLSNEQLMLPYYHYDPESERDIPVIWLVAGNTFQHYAEHQDWIAEIVKR
jgi:uncharacterized protein (TIGR03083 family)